MRATPSRAQRAQDGGCKVFTSWEDIVECKPKMIMCLVCAAMAEDIRRRKAAGLTPRATPRR